MWGSVYWIMERGNCGLANKRQKTDDKCSNNYTEETVDWATYTQLLITTY